MADTSGKNGILIAVIGAAAVILAAIAPHIIQHIVSSPSVVKGRVIDKNGNPIAIAVVKVDEPGIRLSTSTTDSGDYVLIIENGELKKAWHFIASAPDYADRSELLSPSPAQADLSF